jgi:hypothetical protein
MYNGSYNGIESDGTLHRMQMEHQREHQRELQKEEVAETESIPTFKQEKRGLFSSSFLKKIDIDDIILIGIALLLLLDGDGDNDIFVFIIAALVLLQ